MDNHSTAVLLWCAGDWQGSQLPLLCQWGLPVTRQSYRRVAAIPPGEALCVHVVLKTTVPDLAHAGWKLLSMATALECHDVPYGRRNVVQRVLMQHN